MNKRTVTKQLASRLKAIVPDVGTWGARKCRRFLDDMASCTEITDLNELRAHCRSVAQQVANETVVDITSVVRHRVLFGTGGPADWVDLEQTPAGGWRGSYTYVWGTERGTVELDEETAWRLAEVYCLNQEE